jgi:hypothetical protein
VKSRIRLVMGAFLGHLEASFPPRDKVCIPDLRARANMVIEALPDDPPPPGAVTREEARESIRVVLHGLETSYPGPWARVAVAALGLVAEEHVEDVVALLPLPAVRG